MNLLLYREIRPETALPDFGEAFLAHMRSKHNPDVYAASLSAWTLLAEGLQRLGIADLPKAAFGENGKPAFASCPLHFSLSHSGRIAVAMISSRPCGVDVELIRPDIADRLNKRVLSESELHRNEDFFSVWTKKEAAGKLSGKGLPSHPCEMDMSEFEHMSCMQKNIFDAAGQEYRLCAISASNAPIKITDCV